MNDTADEVLTAYEQYLREEERSRTAIRKCFRDVRRSKEYLHLSGETAFQKEQVLAYKQYLNGYYKATNVNSMLAAINSFFDYLGWRKHKVKLPRIQRVQLGGREGELTEKNYEWLAHTAEREGNA